MIRYNISTSVITVTSCWITPFSLTRQQNIHSNRWCCCLSSIRIGAGNKVKLNNSWGWSSHSHSWYQRYSSSTFAIPCSPFRWSFAHWNAQTRAIVLPIFSIVNLRCSSRCSPQRWQVQSHRRWQNFWLWETLTIPSHTSGELSGWRNWPHLKSWVF